ncbi:MAG TPA: co-chaperone DjlA [Gammaproteobacteria bacterium]|nr:co-chaperone DjlA [Gammaproteobacteria bacterium]HQY22995.1 co-chaperone DjlA [Gammaproteobacteria bacterium]HQZ87190.1 co-chaperone DjlA [Gammaproteobacteria bacterium]HRA42251.1 co-chaperone DjlA [Gammaproteobacteria bacterium]
MIIWGRLIGVLFGFKLLGPFGGIIGYMIGSWFDKGLRLHLHQIPRARSVAVQGAFFKATFLVMGHLAKADGHVSVDEIRAAKNIMSRLELNETLKQEAMHLFNSGKSAEFDLENELSNLYQECHRHSDLLRFFVEIQLEAALADGALNTNEKHVLLLICQKLHFSSEEFERLWARQWASQSFHDWFSTQFDPNARSREYHSARGYHTGGASAGSYSRNQGRQTYTTPQPTVGDAYGVLGIASTATIAEIKKAYRRLMNQHHPDKLASRGLPEGMVKMAKEKTQQIRAAYDLVREARGFR